MNLEGSANPMNLEGSANPMNLEGSGVIWACPYLFHGHGIIQLIQGKYGNVSY
jgi:hypothetical protein